ncbi:MAG: ATP-binding cassette domain-containing protein, partial [Firmicutes bacterium]|nr:ATP-binding cassette domain-containing protein [Bacillota bacterium]
MVPIPAQTTPILEVNGLKKHFLQESNLFSSSWLKAVDGVTFTIRTGETLGLVGESGCGKTTVGRTIIGLYEPTAGSVIYKGVNLARASSSRRLKNRRQMQMIFQDPYASLNPRMTVGDIIGEPVEIHQPRMKNKQRMERVSELL